MFSSPSTVVVIEFIVSLELYPKATLLPFSSMVFEIKFNIVCNGFVVGIYSSYERCQEILDEILAFILSKEKYIFEMPKE